MNYRNSSRADWSTRDIPAFDLGETSQQQNEHRLKHFDTSSTTTPVLLTALMPFSDSHFVAFLLPGHVAPVDCAIASACNPSSATTRGRRRLRVYVSLPSADANSTLITVFDEHTRYVSALVDFGDFASMGPSMRWRCVFVQRLPLRRRLERYQGCPPTHRCFGGFILRIPPPRRVIIAASS